MTPDHAPILEVERLFRSFGVVRALSDVSL